ncbi:hypothetical protein CDD83_8632 [Cordyceps sp. RAO-2017]|nr:hypothetical protein CDD83_8632 [Cordyceps sp. RAO-2017]
MRCTLPPHKHPIGFDSYSEYEAHYQAFHTHRCLECHKNFPSNHLLGVHIEECHDPLVNIQRERGEHTFSCFVEGCERKCLTHQKRRMHMIDKHMYPKNYFFAVTTHGIDGRRSLLIDSGHNRRRSSAATQPNKTDPPARAPDGSQTERGVDPSASPSKGEANSDDDRQHVDTEMNDLTGAMSALHFVPSSVRFGKGRAGFAKK